MSLRRPMRVGLAAVAAGTVLLGYYAWTASSSANPFDRVTPFQFKYGDSDYYNLQVDAFLHGQLALRVPVDPALERAANPYDPNLPASRLPDGSFYNGRYYLTWGPGPAITLFAPARLLGFELRENLAVLVYSIAGVLLTWASLALLVRRLVPGVPRLIVWTGNATIALGGALPWILRRPTVYEVAITGAFCFAMGGLYVLLREVTRQSGPRGSGLALSGVLYGLAVLSRPTLGLVAIAMAVPALMLRHEGRLPRKLKAARRRAIVLFIGPVVLAGLCFLVYNAMRFSGPLDFGWKYQFGGRDVRNLPYNELTNVPPALFGYLAAPLRVGLEFPYVHLPPPPVGPFFEAPGYGAESTGSILWSVPFVLLALGVLVRPGSSKLVVRVVVALLAIAAMPLLSGSFAIPGYTERYELDFLPYLVIAATIGWAELARRAGSRRRAAWWRGAGVVLALWGVLVGVAIGFTGYYDSLKTGSPGTFKALERFFSPLPTLVTVVAGHPIITGITAPAGSAPAPIHYTTLGADGSSLTLRPDAPAVVTIVSPDRRYSQLRFQAASALRGPFTLTSVARGRALDTIVRDAQSASVGVRLQRGVNYVQLTVGPGDAVRLPRGAAPPALTLQGVRVT